MILSNGRKLVTYIELIINAHIELVSKHEVLKRELARTRRNLEDALATLQELREAKSARLEATEKLLELYRERDEKRALYRAPVLSETLH
jgi:hypothetical protein